MNQRSSLPPARKLTVAALLVAAAGFVASGAVGNLLDPSRLGVFIGAWVQFLAVIVAVGAGIVAVVQNDHSRTAI